MFSEPRPPVDALRARIRESRTCIREVLPDVNFLVTFAKSALWGPKVPFGLTFRILSPKIDFGPQNALFRPKSLLGQKGLHFHQYSIGFISIRGMGTGKCTFSQKVHFGVQKRKKCKNAILERKSDFGSKNPLFGDPGGQVAILATCMWVRESSKRHFLLQIALFAQKPLFAPKVHFGPKMHFWAQKVILEQKVHFLRFGPEMAPSEACFYRCWCKMQNVMFYVKIPRNELSVKKISNNAEFWKVFRNFTEITFLARRFLLQRCRKVRSHLGPFSPGSILVPKMHFWPRIAFWTPKCIFGPKNAFWGHFCALARNAYETNGFCIGFCTFWCPNAEISTFPHFGPQKCKMSTFLHFGPQKCKKCTFEHFWALLGGSEPQMSFIY